MARLIDAMIYTLRAAGGEGLPNARLTKLLYLADWHSAITAGKQVTPIRWFFDNYGPFVWDVMNAANDDPVLFKVDRDQTAYGNPRAMIRARGTPAVHLDADERSSIDHVVRTTADMPFDQFLRLVYSTHPIVTSRRYSTLDLVAKADEYKVQKAGWETSPQI